MSCAATLNLYDSDPRREGPIHVQCEVNGHHATAELGRAMHHVTLVLADDGDHRDVWWTQPGHDQGDQADADEWRRRAGLT